MKKVLVVIFTEGKLPNSVYKAAINQDYPECSVLISVRKPNPDLDKHTNIMEHMNYSRKLAKSSDADYFFFVESGVVIPKNAVSNLMKQLEQPQFDIEKFKVLEKLVGKIETPAKKHIIGGWCKLTKKHGKIPALYNASRWVQDNVVLSLTSIERSVVKVDKIGSGCLMLSREVMEKINWRMDNNIQVNIENGKGSHLCMCGTFGIDAQDAGYDLWMDGSVVCKHLTVPDNKFEEVKLKIENIKEKIWNLKILA